MRRDWWACSPPLRAAASCPRGCSLLAGLHGHRAPSTSTRRGPPRSRSSTRARPGCSRSPTASRRRRIAGTTLDGEAARRRRPARQGRRRELLGVVVRAVPRRGARRWRRWPSGVRRPRACSSSASTSRTSRHRGAGLRAQARARPTRRCTTRPGVLLTRFRALAPQTPPTTLLLDRQGRIAGRFIGGVTETELDGPVQALLGGAARERRRRLRRDGDQRPGAAGAAGGRGRRARVVPVAVRAAAGARLPVLRHRAVRRRPRRHPRRARPADDTLVRHPSQRPSRRGRVLAGSVLFVLGFSAVFVTTGALFGGLGGALVAHKAVVDRVLGALTVLLGLSFLGPGAGHAARAARPPAARRRASRRAAARRAVRRRLDAVPRPDARRRPDARLHAGQRRPRRAADRRATASASACRSSPPASPCAARSARSTSSSGTTAWS